MYYDYVLRVTQPFAFLVLETIILGHYSTHGLKKTFVGLFKPFVVGRTRWLIKPLIQKNFPNSVISFASVCHV